MQEPKKIFFVKKSCQNFLDVPLLRCRTLGDILGKKKRDPKWDPFSSDYEKRKNVVTLLGSSFHKTLEAPQAYS